MRSGRPGRLPFPALPSSVSPESGNHFTNIYLYIEKLACAQEFFFRTGKKSNSCYFRSEVEVAWAARREIPQKRGEVIKGGARGCDPVKGTVGTERGGQYPKPDIFGEGRRPIGEYNQVIGTYCGYSR